MNIKSKTSIICYLYLAIKEDISDEFYRNFTKLSTIQRRYNQIYSRLKDYQDSRHQGKSVNIDLM